MASVGAKYLTVPKNKIIEKKFFFFKEQKNTLLVTFKAKTKLIKRVTK